MVAMDKKVVVAKAKRDCEELLVTIVQDKRVADEQEKQVNAGATKYSDQIFRPPNIRTKIFGPIRTPYRPPPGPLPTPSRPPPRR